MIQPDRAQLANLLNLALEEAHLSTKQHDWLWQHVQYQKIPFKNTVWHGKTRPRWIAFVAKGFLKKCTIHEKTGEEVILDFYEENQFVLHLEDTSVYYVALQPTEILRWQVAFFDEIKGETHQVTQWLLDRIQDFAARQEKRIQMLLLPTEERYLFFHENYPKLVSKLSVRDTIAYLGISRSLFFRLRKK